MKNEGPVVFFTYITELELVCRFQPWAVFGKSATGCGAISKLLPVLALGWNRQVSSVQLIMGLLSQLFVFTLDFCFELQYSDKPTHPETKIAAGFEADITLGAMTAPPHRGEEITRCPSLITLSPGCRPGPAEAANHNRKLFNSLKDIWFWLKGIFSLGLHGLSGEQTQEESIPLFHWFVKIKDLPR